jgi:integrase
VHPLHKPGPLFDVSSSSLDALYRKARKQTGLGEFTFHDSRATAVTHLANRVPVEVLARITGHRDVSLLVNVYYRTTAADIAAGL